MARGRKKIMVDKEEFQNVINELESENTFKNMSQLFKAVEKTEWAKNCKDEDGNTKPLKSQTAYNRYKKFGLESKTTKGKAGRGGGKKKKEAVQLDPSQVRNRRLAETIGVDKVTRIPAGDCPVRLKGESPEEVFEWCEAIQDHYYEKGECLAPEGMVYYIGTCFHRSNTDEYKKVIGHIYEWVEAMLGVVETDEKKKEVSETVN